MAFPCQEPKGKCDAGRSGKVKVTILASEWGSSKVLSKSLKKGSVAVFWCLAVVMAGLPVLVSKNSGFGEALFKVLYGSLFVIDSVDPEVWAVNIKNIIWDTDRQKRLEEAKGIRKSYQEKYLWAKQSDDLLARIISLVRALPQIDIGVEAVTEGSVRKGTEMEEYAQEPQEVIHELREPSTTKKQQVVATENGGNGSIQSMQAVLNRIADKYLPNVCPSNVEHLNNFTVYLEKLRKVLVLDPIKPGSSIPTAEVGSEEIPEELWKDYRKEDHLNEMAQKFPVIQEEYKACKRDFFGLNADREIGINIVVTGDSGTGKSNFINTLRDRSDLANLPDEGFIITEGRDGGPMLPADAATYQTSGLNHTGANAAADSIYSGHGRSWQATEQSQLMGAGANQANGLSDAVVGGAAQNQTSELIGGPNNWLWQSRSADMTVDQTSGRDYPVMGLRALHVSHNGHTASDIVYRMVYSGEGAQQINGLPGNHEEEPVADEANGSSVHRVGRAWQAREMSFLDHANGGNCRPHGTAAREAPRFPIREDVICSPVQEQGDGCAVRQAPILVAEFQPGEFNLVSSVGNAEKPTLHCCSTEEIKQWKQQLTRSKPKKARKKNNARNPSFTFKITEVAQHRENETPVFTEAVYNDHQEKLFGIRIHPKGVGCGTGIHVALFIHLIKGDFDDSLVWPFAGTITVTILDQSDSSPRSDFCRIIQANPNSPAFQQPDDTICRTGYGYERFALIEEFFGPRYVKDDKLLLKIELSE
ncbi:uncharacterized protein [Montipora capricornis]|uniref:uncharacterized protein isoform X2 n=1 Tax=Montipora capricornis TaxID=246305 RepID=UPI0035F10AAA